MKNYREQALAEYNSAETAAHPGGVNGRPFWNINSSQFMFAPSLQFPWIPGSQGYRFTATDRNGKDHTFTAKEPTASLAPIWGEIPTGFVTLKVESLTQDENITRLAGTRTFFKLDPFPGRENLPKRARSYRESALAAYRFLYNDDMVHYWLEHDIPKPDYAHNVYPAKMISSIMRAMIKYAGLEPENAENALRLACRAADYMISISFPAGHPLEGLPPTYSFDGLDAEVVNKVAPAAQNCVGTTMMIYPAAAGIAYLELYEAVKDEKYLNAALAIAKYFEENRHPSGSWYLQYDCETGKPMRENLCVNFNFINLFHKMWEVTGGENWHTIEKDYFKYITEVCLETYNWEGQFEDVKVSGNYQNLTHFTANHLIQYVAEAIPEDKKMVEESVDLMRFVEDQFVVWGEFAYWNISGDGERHTPTGLEQYYCYVPIDASSAAIIRSFMKMYEITSERLYLEKAMALADVITRMQDSETGLIPTFFIGENCAYGKFNFWINCMFYTASVLLELAELTEKEGIE